MYLAVDLGGTHATCAVVDEKNLIRKVTVDLPDTTCLSPILPDIEQTLHSLAVGREIRGLGIGFCGLVDSDSSRVTATNGKFIDAVEFDFPEWCSRVFHLPFRLENDARLALLGECAAGAAHHETDVAMFTLGTGIGAAILMDGKLLRGKHGQAGVLGGHMQVSIAGRVCSCGGAGCAESEASGWALPRVAAEWPRFSESCLSGHPVNFENLFAAAAAGDSIALAIQRHCLHVWGAVATSAVHAFDPDLLIFGGGVMRSGDVVLPFIQDYVRRNAWTPWGTVRVRAAQLGSDAALLGVPTLFHGKEGSFVR